jgi:hypothetical protein
MIVRRHRPARLGRTNLGVWLMTTTRGESRVGGSVSGMSLASHRQAAAPASMLVLA